MKNWRQVRAAMDIDEVLVAAERQRIEDAQAAGVDLDAVQYFNGRPVYLDRQGQAMTLRAWSTAFSDHAGRTVARTQVGDAEVLTMWMGIDHDPMSPIPLIFGSIIRRGKSWGDEIETDTEEAALEAHRVLVERLKGGT